MQNDFMETHKAQLMPAAQALLPELIALSDALYERPELGYENFSPANSTPPCWSGTALPWNATAATCPPLTAPFLTRANRG